jgi:CHAD domain-containing protein
MKIFVLFALLPVAASGSPSTVPSLTAILSAEGIAPPPTPTIAHECSVLSQRLSTLTNSTSERPRYIHDLRVALRRLFALVDTFSGLLAPPLGLLRELKALRRATNRARDAELLHSALPAFPFPASLLPPKFLRRIRKTAEGLLAHCASREDRGYAADKLANPLRRLAAAAGAAAGGAAAACADAGSRSACFPALHTARTRAKQLRYALRALGRGSGPVYEALSAAQDALGAFGDAEVVMRGLQGLGRKRAGVSEKRLRLAVADAEAAREGTRGAARDALQQLVKAAETAMEGGGAEGGGSGRGVLWQ